MTQLKEINFNKTKASDIIKLLNDLAPENRTS